MRKSGGGRRRPAAAARARARTLPTMAPEMMALVMMANMSWYMAKV